MEDYKLLVKELERKNELLKKIKNQENIVLKKENDLKKSKEKLQEMKKDFMNKSTKNIESKIN